MNQLYKATLVDSLSGMAGLGKDWNVLLAESRSDTIFLTWEWLYTWSERFLGSDRSPFVILVYKENELIGVAPWSIRYLKCLGFSMKLIEFLGLPKTGSDYLDVFAKRGKEKEVACQIYRFLQTSTPLWDGISLQDIPSDSLFLLHFMRQIEEQGKQVDIGAGAYCPSVSLPETGTVFTAQLSPNRRQQFARHLRLLGRNGEIIHRVHYYGEAGADLKEFRRLYEQRWGESEDLFCFLEKFISRSEGKNWIQFDFLSSAGRNIAALLHLGYGKCLSMYLMGVDHSFDKSISIGNIVVGLSIEKAIAAGFTRYDFLRGDEEYKFHWSNAGKRAVHCYYYGKKPAPLLWATGKFLKSAGKILLR